MGERRSLESRRDPGVGGRELPRTDPAQVSGSQRIVGPADARDRCCRTGRARRLMGVGPARDLHPGQPALAQAPVLLAQLERGAAHQRQQFAHGQTFYGRAQELQALRGRGDGIRLSAGCWNK